MLGLKTVNALLSLLAERPGVSSSSTDAAGLAKMIESAKL